MTIFTPQEVLAKAESLFASRYQGADFAFAAGSIMRGEGTAYSDLDLVVLYPQLERGYRESFLYEGLPVEAFVHDAETIQAFMDSDYKDAHPALIHMVATGTVILNATSNSRKLQAYAEAQLASGPGALKTEDSERRRYMISDAIDDLRGDRPVSEQRAILYELYPKMAQLRLRLAGQFSATSKHLSRKLKDCDPVFAEKLEAVMLQAHQGPVTSQSIGILLSLMEALDGILWDGFKQLAPLEMRKTARWKG